MDMALQFGAVRALTVLAAGEGEGEGEGGPASLELDVIVAGVVLEAMGALADEWLGGVGEGRGPPKGEVWGGVRGVEKVWRRVVGVGVALEEWVWTWAVEFVAEVDDAVVNCVCVEALCSPPLR